MIGLWKGYGKMLDDLTSRVWIGGHGMFEDDKDLH